MPDGVEGKLAQIEELLEETAALAKENNDLLRSMRRMNRIGFWTRVILWLVVLGLPILFIGPVFQSMFPDLSGKSSSLFGIPSVEQLQQAFHELQAKSVQQNTQ